RHAETHRAQTAAGDPLPLSVEWIKLRGPHLMLPDVGGNNCFAASQTMQFANDVLGLDLIARAVETQRLFALPTTQLVPPASSLGDAANNLSMIASRDFGAQGSECFARIGDQRKIR